MGYAYRAIVAGWMLATVPAAAGGQVPAPAASVALPDAGSSDDIIVEALRLPRKALPIQVHWNERAMLDSTILHQNRTMFIRCMIRTADRATLRKAVDGRPNDATTRFALGLMMATHRGCYQPTPPAPPDYEPSLNGNDIATRAILIEQILAAFAPDASLDATQTYDPDISMRFKDVENARNAGRLPNDFGAYSVAVCLVQRQSALATRFVRAEAGSTLAQGLAQTLLVEGRACMGHVKRITIDPIFLHFYISEAFYRWLVAARGVDSLIPLGRTADAAPAAVSPRRTPG